MGVQVDYKPLSSVEQSRTVVQEFMELWQEGVVSGQFISLEPNYTEFSLPDQYSWQHTSLQYVTLMTFFLSQQRTWWALCRFYVRPAVSIYSWERDTSLKKIMLPLWSTHTMVYFLELLEDWRFWQPLTVILWQSLSLTKNVVLVRVSILMNGTLTILCIYCRSK